MTIDINKLRRLTQAALTGPDGVSLKWVKLLQDFQKEANPSAISELLDRLEVVEKDNALKEKIIDSLGAELNAVVKERDAAELMSLALRAKIEAMERQEPAAWTTRLALELGSSALGFDACRGNLWGDKGIPLYALPGAKGE